MSFISRYFKIGITNIKKIIHNSKINAKKSLNNVIFSHLIERAYDYSYKLNFIKTSVRNKNVRNPDAVFSLVIFENTGQYAGQGK